MKTWKSKRQDKPGVWTSEIRLNKADAIRINRVNKLLKLLEKEGFNANLS